MASKFIGYPIWCHSSWIRSMRLRKSKDTGGSDAGMGLSKVISKGIEDSLWTSCDGRPLFKKGRNGAIFVEIFYIF